ncbi:MAG TPA: outer membrane beta-barrel protein [Flavisolibacter sp.]|nr:outer membrane beta-barrel protein [Flavisolibacter sp.]
MPLITKSILFFILFLSFAWQLKAQNSDFHFRVVNNKNEKLPFATITILSVPDTMHQQSIVADSIGRASIALTDNHPYIIRATLINYQLYERKITVYSSRPEYILQMQPSTSTLKNVVITANRPLMRQEDDKTIVDPENLAAASTNGYEILEKTPGIYVDQDGNVYLNSTTPAVIYINGREQKMSAADIATMLKNLPPNAIASIEIIRTPSAKYDASGSGGIVNIVLRKGVRIGLTGSVTAGANQGKYGNEFIGININNNNGNLSSYINLQFNKRNSYDEVQTNRKFTPDSILSQDAVTKYPGTNIYAGYGINYQFNKKWEFSYDGRLSLNTTRNTSSNLSLIETAGSNNIVSENNAFVNNKGNNYNITQGLNLKNKFDTIGSEWTTDLSYTLAPNSTNQNILTQFYIPANSSFPVYGDINNHLQFFSAQSNLVKKMPHSITLETGVKTSVVSFTNSTDYYRFSGSDKIKDNQRTGAYNYSENINAVYVQASKSMNGIVLKAGTRMENTNMSGHQVLPTDTSFGVHRTDLFPYVYLSRKIMKIAGYELKAYLVYRRTISRPAYEYLNPSTRFIDPYLYETGNPSLKPQFTKNYEANVSVDERPIVAIGVNNTTDIFTQVVYPTDSSKRVSARTYDNLGTNKEVYFRALGAIPPGKRYFFVVGVQYNHNFYNGQYQNAPFQFDRGSFTTFMYQTFKITPLTIITLNGFARFNGQFQFYELSSFGSLNMSLSQQFFKKKMTVTLSGNDLFFTNNNHFILKAGTVDASGYRESDTRRFGINVRYNFGIRKKEESNLLNVESPENRN